MPTLRTNGVRMPALFHQLYSESGYGKTTIAAALMALLYERTGKPSYYYDWDSSAGDIPSCVPSAAYEVAVPNRANPANDMQESILQCTPERYAAYVVDTTTMLSQAVLQSCPPQATRSGKPSFPYNYSDAQAKFNQWALQMYPLVDKGVHVLWLLHEGFDNDEDAQGVVNAIGGPATRLGAKFLRIVPAFSRQIYRIVVRPSANGAGVTRWLQVESDGIFIAKDRLNAFPDFIRTGVPIGVSPVAADGGMKTADVFEGECIAMGERVWVTVLEAMERRAGTTPGTPLSPISTESQKLSQTTPTSVSEKS